MPTEITLHSSWRGFLSALAGAVALVGIALFAILSRGAHPISVTVLVVGAAALAVVLFDYPVATRFSAEGIQRRTPLRRPLLVWDRVDRFTRASPSPRLNVHRDGPARSLVRLKPSGLVAAVGRRRYLLVNRCESLGENTVLRALVRDESEALADTLDRPPEGTPPTWSDRRKRWGSPETAL